jgi:CRP-like cAMP-binding protein
MASPVPHREPTATWPSGSLLKRLTQDSRDRLLGLGTLRRYRPREVLFHQGARDSHVALLIRAVTKVTCTGPDGREALLAIRVSGDTVGEMAALNDHPRTATVVTCGPAVVRIIQRRQFRAFLHTDSGAALEFAGMVSDRLRSANRKRVDFAVYPTQVRVARILDEMVLKYGRPTDSGIAIGVRLTQPEIAALVGAADVTIQKALRALRAQRLIQTGYGRITVVDPYGLRAAARWQPWELTQRLEAQSSP